MELSSDPEIYENKLKEIEENIIDIEPDFDPDLHNINTKLQKKYTSNSHVFIGTDIIRSTEVLFKPYIIGNFQKGLIESIHNSLKNLENSHI